MKKGVFLVMFLLCSSAVFGESYTFIRHYKSSPFRQFKVTESHSEIDVLSRKELPYSKQSSSLFFKGSHSDRVELISVESDLPESEILEQLNQQEGVVLVERNEPLELFSVFSDPLLIEQDYLLETSLYQLWSLDTNAEIVVAVVDTGVDVDHEDLEAALYVNSLETHNGIDDDGNGYVDDVSGYRWLDWMSDDSNNNPNDDHGHGTHLSGVIAAQNNSIGITGVQPNAKIMPLKIFNQNGSATQAEAALAIRYAVDQGAHVINCSWGYYNQTKALSDAINYAEENGVIVVSAVGNHSIPVGIYPANYEHSIGVGASTSDDGLASYSNYGSQVDFLARGTNVYSTLPHDRYGVLSGTSQSTAIVSGIIASLLAVDPTLSKEDIYSLLRQSSSSPLEKDSSSGYGVLSSQSLLAGFGETESIQLDFSNSIESDLETGSPLDSVVNAPNPVTSETTTFYFSSEESGLPLTISLYDLEGLLVKQYESVTSVGKNTVTVDMSSLSNGVYVYAVNTANSDRYVRGLCAVLR